MSGPAWAAQRLISFNPTRYDMKKYCLVVLLLFMAVFLDWGIRVFAYDFEERYPSGQLKSKITTNSDGSQTAVGYYEDGSLQSEAIMKNYKVMASKTYRKNGKLKTIISVNQNNIMETKHFDEDGNPTDAMLEGVLEMYHKNGKLKSRITDDYHAVYSQTGLLRGCEGKCESVEKQV